MWWEGDTEREREGSGNEQPFKQVDFNYEII